MTVGEYLVPIRTHTILKKKITTDLELNTNDYISNPIYKHLTDGIVHLSMYFPLMWQPQCDFDVCIQSGSHTGFYTFHVSDFPRYDFPLEMKLQFPDADYYLENLGVLIPITFRFTSYDGIDHIDSNPYVRVKVS